MRSVLAILGLAVGVAACGYTSAYEAQVHDWEPVYCYKTLAAVECEREPDRTRDARLVNYYGPDPSRTDKPELPAEVRSAPPQPVNYWVKDPEPIPRPAPSGDLADRPWLTPGGQAAVAPAPAPAAAPAPESAAPPAPAETPVAAPAARAQNQPLDLSPPPPIRSL